MTEASRPQRLDIELDKVSAARRSAIMAAIPQRNTKPEIVVRRELHAAGLRFRLHCRDLPGSPDIVLPRWRTVVFVHGCFWHRHECGRTSAPKSRSEYWADKFNRNVLRDKRQASALRRAGWRVVVIWECATVNRNALRLRLKRLFPVVDVDDACQPKMDGATRTPQLSPAADFFAPPFSGR